MQIYTILLYHKYKYNLYNNIFINHKGFFIGSLQGIPAFFNSSNPPIHAVL